MYGAYLDKLHTTIVTWLCLSQNQFIPELGCHLAGSSRLVLHIFFFFKLSIPYIGSLDKYHTSTLTHSHTMTPFDAPVKQAF